ncbi:universal stress protein [Dactylosporangium sp. NPDC051541]|uniref:universal stress protein n=1 Tax=Dactylosporangium sp. NPDC051541 TaxID=3363977 RepID=UPI0037948948
MVAAVDGRHPAAAVLAFAFRAAQLRGAELWVLSGCDPRRGPLTAALDDWSAAFPDVKTATGGWHTPDLARTLVQASASAGLTVVGSHRRDDLSGGVLGPAAYTLVHQAGCPVVVVHPEDGAPAGPDGDGDARNRQ